MLPLIFMMNGVASKRRHKSAINKIIGENGKIDHPALRCRTCLGTNNLQNIFCDKEQELKRSNEFSLICGLDVRPDDGLPQKICKQCSQALELALRFRRTSRKTEKSLVKLVCNKAVRIDKKPKKAKVTVEYEPELSYDYNDILGEDFFDCSDDVPIAQEVKKTQEKKKRQPSIPQYRCNTCSKDFKMKATYKAHMRFHTNYCVCEMCGKRCRNRYQLEEHKRAKHDLGKIHKCTYCEYSSATKEALVIHERRHTGERPYVCDHCGATFHRRANLVQHLAVHNTQYDYQCDLCPKRLKSRKFLQIHKHNAHTGRRYGYLCGACGHRFDKPNKVRAHARRVHALPDERQPPIVRVQV